MDVRNNLNKIKIIFFWIQFILNTYAELNIIKINLFLNLRFLNYDIICK